MSGCWRLYERVEDGRVDLEALVAELLARCETPGAAIGLVEAGEQTIVAAGDRGGGRGPVENDTIFAAASLTKPVFALAVMALADGGLLELDRPPSEYLPVPYLPEDERAAWITARMVLSHTTGFPNWREGSDDRVHPPHGRLHLRWPPGRAGATPGKVSHTSSRSSSDSALRRLPTAWLTWSCAHSA